MSVYETCEECGQALADDERGQVVCDACGQRGNGQ